MKYCFMVHLQVPLGLASALGYMHLGQLARVKVPQHFMHEAVKQEDGEGVRPCGGNPGYHHPSRQPGRPSFTCCRRSFCRESMVSLFVHSS